MSDSSSPSLPIRFYVIALVTLFAAIYMGFQAGQNSDSTQALRDELAACLERQVTPVDPDPVVAPETQPEAVSADAEPASEPSLPARSTTPVPGPTEN